MTALHPHEFFDLSPDALRRLQDERLRRLLDQLGSSPAPYWRQKLDGVDIAGLDDIASLPTTVKQEFRDTYPTGMVAVPDEDVVRVHASSGTSGKATIVSYTKHDVGVFAEVNARALALAGGTAASTVHVAYGYGLFTGGLGLHYGVERLGARAVPASGGNPAFQAGLLGDLGADGLAATPSFTLLLAERAADDGMLGRIRLRWGVHGAESWSEGMRSKIEEAWEGTYDACDIYGLSEIIGPGVASEWAEHKGSLVIAEDHFYPEVVDPLTGAPLPDGELGELVLTTLTKEAHPVIRYRTGDITRLLPPVGGLPFRRIDRLQGRADDMLIVRGINVYPREIEAVVLDDEALSGHYAIVMDRRATLVEARVVAEAKDDSVDRAATAARIQDRLRDTTRLRMEVEIREPGGVPRQQIGKAKRVFEQTDDADPLG